LAIQRKYVQEYITICFYCKIIKRGSLDAIKFLIPRGGYRQILVISVKGVTFYHYLTPEGRTKIAVFVSGEI
jgi:hypothetical protein